MRRLPVIVTAAAFAMLAAGAESASAQSGTAVTSPLDVVERLEEIRSKHGVTALLVGIGVGEAEPVVASAGTSMTGVPATTAMHFRIGAMAIASMTTILLQLVDEGVVKLDDTIDAWLPDYPAADKVTLRMLADSSSGYGDYVYDKTFVDAFIKDVFYEWTADELLKIAFAQGMKFEPGTGFQYAHTNFIVLAQALAAATGESYEQLLQARILDRLDLAQTKIWTTAALPDPPLHAFTTERGIFEDSTYWSPSWTSYTGPLNGDAADTVKLMRALATGETISPKSLEEMKTPTNLGKNGNTEERYFSLGMEFVEPWIRKTFSFGGYGGTAGYLPSADLTIAVVTTLGPENDPGQNPSTPIFHEIGAMLGQ